MSLDVREFTAKPRRFLHETTSPQSHGFFRPTQAAEFSAESCVEESTRLCPFTSRVEDADARVLLREGFPSTQLHPGDLVPLRAVFDERVLWAFEHQWGCNSQLGEVQVLFVWMSSLMMKRRTPRDLHSEPTSF